MRRRGALRLAGLVSLVVVLFATSVTGPGSPVRAQPDDDPELGSLETPDPDQPRFDTAGWRTDLSLSSVPLSEIVPGGPPKDGIVAIDAPVFESIAAAEGWLPGNAPVIALEIDGDARAYPLAIVSWHEIVNDTVGGTPVVVTFCPLCNTALVYDRALGEDVFEFGVSGLLRFSDLIMFDRETETFWQQATGHGIVGELTGSRLAFRVAQLISLDQFAKAWPSGRVLSRDTGQDRRYGDNPYTGYDSVDEAAFFYSGEPIGRLAPKDRVVAVGEGADGIAFPHSTLRKVGVAEESVDGEPIVVFWEPRAGPDSAGSEEVGSTGVFSSFLDGQSLTFTRQGGEGTPITDVRTDSTWTVTGRAIEGPLAGTVLQPVLHGDHFWFAWALFAPETRIWTLEGTVRFGEDD